MKKKHYPQNQQKLITTLLKPKVLKNPFNASFKTLSTNPHP